MDKEKVVLNGSTFEIDDIRYKFNLLEIDFSDEIDVSSLVEDMSIFNSITILTRGGQECAVYEGYNTVYLLDNHSLTLSNDGSVYVEPEIPEIEFPEPYIPTLEDVKLQKIVSCSSICNQSITDGVDVEINGEIEHFSFKQEDQTNIKDAFDLALQTNMDIPYHQDGGACKLYTADQIITLYISEKTNLTHHTTYFNQLKMYIMTLETIDDVEAVSYGDQLTGEYLDSYNTAMTQAQSVIDTLLASRKVVE